MSDLLSGKIECAACGNAMSDHKKAWMRRCSHCGLLASVLQPAIPAEKSATALNESVRLQGLAAARKRTNHMILNSLKCLQGDVRSSLLDVGCGHGLFVADALAQGFQAEGIEPDANVIDGARNKTSATIHHGFFPADLPPDKRYDAIVFNDVLEHIPEARATVVASFERLRPGGVLVLNCPDQRGVFYRIASVLDRVGFVSPLLRMWQYGLPSPHVWYFADRHLITIGEESGFDHVDTVQSPAITVKGLKQRVSYVNNQSPILNAFVIAGAYIMLPFLRFLPNDTSIVLLQKPRG